MKNAMLAASVAVLGWLAMSPWVTPWRPAGPMPAAVEVPQPARPGPGTATAKPPRKPARAALAPPAPQPDREIARLGREPPRYPDEARRRFEESPDLLQFTHDVLSTAVQGDGASRYYVYMALEECRAFLALDAVDAYSVFEETRRRAGPQAVEELLLADREHRRCRTFAGGDLTEVVEAMAGDVPGAAVEYGSVWFELAVESGYPPALANLALRQFDLSPGERVALLEQAVAARDPDVYWRLFGQASVQGADDAVNAPAVAWLILACRAGLDCREQAWWYRAWRCGLEGGADCPRGESAIEHYWSALAPAERLRAYRLAAELEARIAAGHTALLPWPALPGSSR